MSNRFMTDPERYPELRNILQIHPLAKSGNSFHEALTPFYFTVLSNRAQRPERSTLALFAPGTSLYLPPVPQPQEETPVLSLHHHNCFEFTYIVEGSMYQIVEGRRYYYPAGSCCLMSRNTLHTEENTTDYTCVFISLTEEFVSRLAYFGHTFLFPREKETLKNPIFSFLLSEEERENAGQHFFLDFVPKITQYEQEHLVHRLYEEMLQTMIEPGIGATYHLLELLLRFMGTLGDERYYHVNRVSAESNVDKLLLSRVDRILDQRHGRISNRELAALLHYNGSYLGRIVKKHTGKSLFDYSMNFTMTYAAQLLRETDKTAATIASELKFTNHSHFYRIFRERYGMTPAEYRRVHRGR